MLDCYSILGISRNASFDALRRAYRRRAKDCHPDKFENSSAKTAEFQELVAAFDILSDPRRRRAYDLALDEECSVFSFSGDPDLDSEADDILEELMVGNRVPPESTLATLLADLAKTEIFLKFRQGKYFYAGRNFLGAEACFRQVLEIAPENLLYRLYLARTLRATGRVWRAIYHYQRVLRIGARRNPPLGLSRLRREYQLFCRKASPFWSAILGNALPSASPFLEDEAELMTRQLGRQMSRELQRGNEHRRLENH